MVDVFEMVTDRIIIMLEQGDIPWHRPWTGAGSYAIKRASGQPYSLLNQMLLGNTGEYLSFKQCQQEGGKVRKGAKSKIVVFWKMIEAVDVDGSKKQIPFLRYMNVFHIDDCEGLAPKHYELELRNFSPIEKAEQIITDYIQRSGIKLEHIKQGRAYYQPATDTVILPVKEQFLSEAAYYSVAFHELTHSTGHSSRLDREIKNLRGDDGYSKEELVAEIGSASIMNYLGIETDTSVRNNAAYIQSWIKALKNDKRLIVSAASRAQKAAALILDNDAFNEYNQPKGDDIDDNVETVCRTA